MSMTRFWGTVLALKPRLILTKFAGETQARNEGVLALLDGTCTVEAQPPVSRRFSVALGPATQVRREIRVGDLLRGEAYPVPPTTPDVPADFYRVGVLRTIARAGDPGTASPPDPDPPRTDPPLTYNQALVAPRRALHPDNLSEGASCELCPYGVLIPVVRLTDPREYRSGFWQQVPACLGPEECPWFVPRTR